MFLLILVNASINMMMNKEFATFVFALISLTSAKLVRVDLTHTLAENTTAYWGMVDAFTFTKQVRSQTPFYETNTFCTSEHGGTHVDAPRHFAKGKHGTNEIPLERLIAKPYFVDVSSESSANRDYEVDVAKLTEVEGRQGRIPDGAMLLIYTGFSLKWNNLTEYFGGNPTDPSTYHFPGLLPAAAQWLVDNRKIASFGLDTPSVDFGQSKTYQSHVILYEQNIPGFENVDLSKLKPIIGKDDLMVFALPIKIKDGSGGPMRMVATYDDDKNDISSAIMTMTSFTLVVLALIVNALLV